MKKSIITVSREFGSGGRTIGKTVAQRLGIPYYDKELVKQVALESGFDPKYIEEQGEFAPGKTHFAFSFLGRGVPGVMGGMTAADFLWTIQHNVIRDLADKGPCVIVGRCADYILKDRTDCRRWPRRSGCRTRTPAAASTTSTTPTGSGACLKTTTCVWSPACWGSTSVWTSFWTWRKTARTPQNKPN